MVPIEARRISVTGIVQGVGFRPFIYQLARSNGLTGWVRNTSGNVTMVVEGEFPNIDRFLDILKKTPPPQSHIEEIVQEAEPVKGYRQFEISNSLVDPGRYQMISPDLATCPDCRMEIFDKTNRRYRYPFTNCTACGPRFTIIEAIPYDRERTTMREFRMCPDCRAEYEDPSNRRFHAQPNACPVCGPVLLLVDSQGRTVESGDVIADAARLLKEGCILAVKGLGGFLLACDATSSASTGLLRTRKQRPAKPFAVMVRDLAVAGRICHVSERESRVLASTSAPIVLLKIRENAPISPLVAPGLDRLGVMLPYTPLHYLLLEDTGLPLVMTSGNLSEEPIAGDNGEALDRLKDIADYFVLHDRQIYSRYDDSVVMVELDSTQIARRARGYAPYPVKLPFSGRQILACGAEMKNTFCLTRDNQAFVSQHIGDMENEETLEHFERTLKIYESLFSLQPSMMACDLHPDYLSTRWAEEEAAKRDLPLVRVQHHHAHIAACMAENGVSGQVIGVALDGTGLGTDRRIWGCEFLVADYQCFNRKAHLEYLPQPGGDAAVHRPYRTAIGYLYSLLGNEDTCTDLPPFQKVDEVEIELIKKQAGLFLNTPLTSSCGRLFDAVSSILGICQQADYDGQAAAELEAAAGNNKTDSVYPFLIEENDGLRVIRIKEMLAALVCDFRGGKPAGVISAVFHDTIVQIIVRVCLDISQETGLKKVALSGGVFQNRRLLRGVYSGLKAAGLLPLHHLHLPSNDGCISLGQAVVGNFSSPEN
ncbi:MAG: carbamoyltransferase HypF [Dehalococcoidales bacterium]|nr:carbamoyltransferase HypF [Dehalococcoidales bacterium]